jgi:hypothetical protein
LQYQQNLRLIGADTSKRDTGTLVHSLLARYYTIRTLEPGRDWLQDGDRAWNEFVATKEIQSFGFDLQETGKFLRERWSAYLMQYPPEFDGIKPIRSKDGRAGIEVGFAKIIHQDHEKIYIIEGRIDALSKVLNHYGIVWDHKSQDKAQDFYKFTPQFKTYTMVTGYKYCGVNYFGLQDKVNEQTFRRRVYQIPQYLIDEWRQIVISKFDKVYAFLKGEYQLEKNRGTCPGTYDSHPCIFTRICDEPAEKHEIIKWFNFIKVKPWKPWMEEEVLMEI